MRSKNKIETSLQRARRKGEKYYIGRLCPKKHNSVRLTSNSCCKECAENYIRNLRTVKAKTAPIKRFTKGTKEVDSFTQLCKKVYERDAKW